MVTVVTTAVNPPGGAGVVIGGGTDCRPAHVRLLHVVEHEQAGFAVLA
jgi:hypothetical protein